MAIVNSTLLFYHSVYRLNQILYKVGSKSKSADLLIFTRSVRILAQIWLTSWLVDVCVTHLKLKLRWLSLEYHPPNWKISLTYSVTQSILSQ